ncbi:hypothetical protein FFB58_00785 [Enterobacter sp. MF024]|uniref:hypothetical protein n=1 Tax=Enterobacter sp. MF024 TaxID=2555644 RepID=UPI00110578F4|nr:hypothetical protein [Enterobacter sp. MF024]TLU69591.1 hypothetical protein FFB58_00785 [Enterobacter sp. MF024]
MATQSIELTAEWVSLTSGNQSAFLQIETGMAYWCDSDAEPLTGAAVHRLLDEIKFTPPMKIWIRSGPSSKAKVIVTTWE